MYNVIYMSSYIERIKAAEKSFIFSNRLMPYFGAIIPESDQPVHYLAKLDESSLLPMSESSIGKEIVHIGVVHR